MKKLVNKAKAAITNNYAYTVLCSVFASLMCAAAPAVTFAAGGSLDNVLKNVGTIGGIIVGIIAVIIIIMDAPKIAKGEKAVGKTIVKVLILLLFAGLMIVATNIQTLQTTFGGIASDVTDIATDTANKTL